MIYADRLRAAREVQGTSLGDVAARLTLAGYPTTSAAVGHWEHGVRVPTSGSKVRALHVVLGIEGTEEAEREWIEAMEAPRRRPDAQAEA